MAITSLTYITKPKFYIREACQTRTQIIQGYQLGNVFFQMAVIEFG